MFECFKNWFPALRRSETMTSLPQNQAYTAHVRILCNSDIENDTKFQYCIKISQPIIDLVVAVIAVPLLVMFSLLLQTHLHELYDMDNEIVASDSINVTELDVNSIIVKHDININRNRPIIIDNIKLRWIVFGLCIALLTLVVVLCGYIGQRLGIRLWRRKQHIIHRIEERFLDDIEMHQNCSIQLITEEPPSYDLVVNFYDIPPPAYHTIKLENLVPANDLCTSSASSSNTQKPPS